MANVRLINGAMMCAFQFFEELRRANADWYTAGPLESLTDEQLVELADRSGMAVEELRRHLAAPHVEATCPLCGRPQTHLVGCKGCGGDAWGGEFELAYGEEARSQLRRHLRQALGRTDELAQNFPGEQTPSFTDDQIQHAGRQAYGYGGCMVCAECWRNTLPYDAYLTCPLNLLSKRVLEPGGLFRSLLMVMPGKSTGEEAWRQTVREWIATTWDRWVEVWNTVPEGAGREAVAAWRALILQAVWLK